MLLRSDQLVSVLSKLFYVKGPPQVRLPIGEHKAPSTLYNGLCTVIKNCDLYFVYASDKSGI